jgi:valyl-tRNA synthetase
MVWGDFIKRLARLSEIDFPGAVPPQAIQLVVRGELVALPLAGVIDIPAERARLEREGAKIEADIKRVDAKLRNPDFIARAPEEVVEGEREKRDEAEGRRVKIAEALERLEGVT